MAEWMIDVLLLGVLFSGVSVLFRSRSGQRNKPMKPWWGQK